MLTQALVIAGGVVPLGLMLVCLFLAVWIREGRREREAVASHSHSL